MRCSYGVARRPGQAGADATRHHRRAVLPAHSDRLHGVLDGTGHHEADWHLTVVGRVGAVGAAAVGIKPDLATDPLRQRALKPGIDWRPHRAP